jgi:Na+/H+-dicarboxylate symporter
MEKKRIPLHWRIIMGLIAGILYALISINFGWNQFTLHWIDPFGTIFIRLLKFIAVPLVLFSIISGISTLPDPSKLGRMGVKTLGLYLFTTMSSIGLGLLLANLAQPGSFITQEQRIKNRIKYEIWADQTPGVAVMDSQDYRNNPKYAAYTDDAEKMLRDESGNQTVNSRQGAAEQFKSSGPLQFFVDMVPDNIFSALSSGQSMLQVIFFAVFFGIVTMFLPKDTVKPVLDVINGANEVFLKMVEWIMEAAPFFVFALMSGVLAKMAKTPAEALELFKGLLSYSLVVFAGLFLLVTLFYPSLILMFIRKIPFATFFRRVSPAQFLAFSTSSSAATLPVTMECVRDNLGVSKNVTNFVLPIGATVNMDGTALYQAVAVIFLAQLHLIDLTLTQQLTIVLTATLASIGSAAVPSAGLIMLIVVLQSVGLNPAWIAIIFPVDRILDMCRTVVNVTSDITVATIVAHSENELDYKQE